MWKSEQTLRRWRMWGCEVFVTHSRAFPSLQIQNSIWIFCIWFFSCPSHHQLIHVKHYIIFFLLLVIILQINGGHFIFRWTESFLITRNMKEKKGLIFHKPHQSPVCCRLHHHCCSRWFRLLSPAWHTKKLEECSLKNIFFIIQIILFPLSLILIPPEYTLLYYIDFSDIYLKLFKHDVKMWVISKPCE